MNFKIIVTFSFITVITLFPGTILWASENTTCRPFTEKELAAIKASNKPDLIMGAGVVDLILAPESAAGNDLLGLASRIESPKGVATEASIAYQLHYDSPLKQFREKIVQLLQDDKDNALAYYLNALLQQEEAGDQEALAQIKKGNAKIYNSYQKQIFHSIAEAAEMAKCSGREARRHAFWSSNIMVTYVKLRQLCSKLVESNGLEARSACSFMGQNLEQAGLTEIQQLAGLAIQGSSLDDSSSNAAARMVIKKKRADIMANVGRTSDISDSDVTEDADLKYYEIFLKSGEAAAQDFLFDFVKKNTKRTNFSCTKTARHTSAPSYGGHDEPAVSECTHGSQRDSHGVLASRRVRKRTGGI